uniref:Uncharacterized protein n=1 Tax=Glossina pallidipes TaxID=7398 RepID=A0A1A9ZZS8_GLOPL
MASSGLGAKNLKTRLCHCDFSETQRMQTFEQNNTTTSELPQHNKEQTEKGIPEHQPLYYQKDLYNSLVKPMIDLHQSENEIECGYASHDFRNFNALLLLTLSPNETISKCIHSEHLNGIVPTMKTIITEGWLTKLTASMSLKRFKCVRCFLATKISTSKKVLNSVHGFIYFQLSKNMLACCGIPYAQEFYYYYYPRLLAMKACSSSSVNELVLN